MSLYRRPEKSFYILPNKIFTIDLDPYAFKIYSYLMSCAGSKGYCWPSLHTISRVTGIAVSTVKNRIDYLAKRKLISISKHAGKGHYKNNVYTMLSLDNPEVYRDLSNDSEELPLPEDIDRRREATVSPVSAFVKNMEHQPLRESLGQVRPPWTKGQKHGFPNFLEGYGLVQILKQEKGKVLFAPFLGFTGPGNARPATTFRLLTSDAFIWRFEKVRCFCISIPAIYSSVATVFQWVVWRLYKI